jgi:hypothetical protein
MPETPTRRTLRVWTDGGPIAYIRLPVSRVDEVREILTKHGVSHWAESLAVSLDGRPPMTVINLGRGVDAARVQALLDQSS